LSPAGGLLNVKGDCKGALPAAGSATEAVGQALALPKAKRSGKA